MLNIFKLFNINFECIVRQTYGYSDKIVLVEAFDKHESEMCVHCNKDSGDIIFRTSSKI